MDELIIDDKKYVSSKRAASLTGYAKDYIGQLCREGRVQARLVGRSWYVLEAAISDHRFGPPQQNDKKASKGEENEPILPPTWEAPRYEASAVEEFPSIPAKEEPLAREEKTVDLHESWKSWFAEGNSEGEEAPTEAQEEVVEPTQEPEEEKILEELRTEEEVAVPIRAVYEPEPQPAPQEYFDLRRAPEAQNRAIDESFVFVKKERVVRKVGGSGRVVQLVAIFIGLISLGTAVIGSGYFDKYVLSVSQIQMIAGVNMYQK